MCVRYRLWCVWYPFLRAASLGCVRLCAAAVFLSCSCQVLCVSWRTHAGLCLLYVPETEAMSLPLCFVVLQLGPLLV